MKRKNNLESSSHGTSLCKIAKVDLKNPNEGLLGVCETLPSGWNLLSALPDLPMACLLHFLVVPASSSTDNLVGEDVPEIVRPLALQVALGWRWDYEQTDRHAACQQQRLFSDDVLALRLTCQAVCHAVDTILRLPMAVLGRVDGWLRSQPLLNVPEERRVKKYWYTCTEHMAVELPENKKVWKAYCGRVGAKLLQLWHKDVLDYVWREWCLGPDKRWQLDRVLGNNNNNDGSAAQLRVEHYSYLSAFHQSKWGNNIYSVASITLPGHEVAELCLTVVGGSDGDFPGQDVCMTLHTRSPMWVRLLGLDQKDPKPRDKCTHPEQKTRSATTPDLFHHQFLVFVYGEEWCMQQDMLAKLWHAINGNDEASTTMGWTAREILIVLFGCLGHALKRDVSAMFSIIEDDPCNQMQEVDMQEVDINICLWEERSKSRAFVDGFDAFVAGSIEDDIFQAGSAEYRLKTWRLVERALHAHYSHGHVRMAGRALAAVHERLEFSSDLWYCNTPAQLPQSVEDQFQVLRCVSCHFYIPSQYGTDGHTEFVMASVDFFVRLPQHDGGYLIFRFEKRGPLQMVQMRFIGQGLRDTLLGSCEEQKPWLLLCCLYNKKNSCKDCGKNLCICECVKRAELLRRIGHLLGLTLMSPINSGNWRHRPLPWVETEYSAQVADFLFCFAGVMAFSLRKPENRQM